MIVKGRLRIGEAKRSERAGAAKGIALGTEHLLQVSRTRVPLEEGTLERSGAASTDTASLTGAVSFDTPYAVVQHEELGYRHDAGRQAKYLESAFTGERIAVAAIITREIRSNLKS